MVRLGDRLCVAGSKRAVKAVLTKSQRPGGPALVRTEQEEAASTKAGAEVSEAAGSVCTLALDFEPPESREDKLCQSHPVCGTLLWHC